MTDELTIDQRRFAHGLRSKNGRFLVTGESGGLGIFFDGQFLSPIKNYKHLRKLWLLLTDEKLPKI